MTEIRIDPLDRFRAQHANAGWWVFQWGGLFDSTWAEDPPVAHAVNIGLSSDTACGIARFAKVGPGGSWGPSLDRLGGLQPLPDEPRIEPCESCLAVVETLP